MASSQDTTNNLWSLKHSGVLHSLQRTLFFNTVFSHHKSGNSSHLHCSGIPLLGILRKGEAPCTLTVTRPLALNKANGSHIPTQTGHRLSYPKLNSKQLNNISLHAIDAIWSFKLNFRQYFGFCHDFSKPEQRMYTVI